MSFWDDLGEGFKAIGRWLKHDHPADKIDTGGNEPKPASGDPSKASGDSSKKSGG